MPRQFKTARKMCRLKLTEAAKELGVSQPTLSSWESERKSPTIESVIKMAELYNVSVDFLLGRVAESRADIEGSIPSDSAISQSNLRIMHGNPVWSKEYGWMIVDSINSCLIAPDGVNLPFNNDITFYYKAESFSEGGPPKSVVLEREEVSEYDRVWVEPISIDNNLRQELRGWYSVMSNWVENSAGNRFLFDTYKSKWLAYSEI